MNTDDCWADLVALDEEYLEGGAVLSELCSIIIRDADIAFVHGAYLSAIFSAVSGVETYLRAEYSTGSRQRLTDLIDQAPLLTDLKTDLHRLRKYRNRWVHVDSPWDDCEVLKNSDEIADELAEIAFFAMTVLRRTIYENPAI